MVPQDILPGGRLILHPQRLIVQQPGGHAPAGDGKEPAVLIPAPLALVHHTGEYRLPVFHRREGDHLGQ